MTVVETPGFLRDAAAALTDEEMSEVIWFLAANPDVGDIMPETGGVESCVGGRREEASAVACGLSTTTTMSRCRCF
jgi:hypothetical protein